MDDVIIKGDFEIKGLNFPKNIPKRFKYVRLSRQLVPHLQLEEFSAKE